MAHNDVTHLTQPPLKVRTAADYDAEAAALRVVTAALLPLDDEARNRVLWYVRSYYRIDNLGRGW